jgi:hypothetical protein
MVASKQGGIAEGSFDGVDETIDSMAITAKIMVGACWPEGERIHQHPV